MRGEAVRYGSNFASEKGSTRHIISLRPFVATTCLPSGSTLSRMLKKSEALEKPMSTRLKMTENYPVKLLFGLILTRFADSGI